MESTAAGSSSTTEQTIDLRDRVFVHILESPQPMDLLDGRTEGRTLVEALRLGGIRTAYNLAVNRQTFFEAFGNRLVAAMEELNGRIPLFLHLSMHGNDEGIALTDGELLTWAELRGYFRVLNKAVSGLLCVTMSTCHGASGIRMAMDEKGELPFAALVGSFEATHWHDAAIAFATFYHLMFKGATKVETAVHAMCEASGDPTFGVLYGHKIRQNWIEYIQKRTAKETASAVREIVDSLPPPTPEGENK